MKIQDRRVQALEIALKCCGDDSRIEVFLEAASLIGAFIETGKLPQKAASTPNAVAPIKKAAL
jgi:hypothetical protein